MNHDERNVELTMNDACLFVGGGSDGKRIRVPDLPFIRLPVMRLVEQCDPEVFGEELATEEYRKETLATEKREFELYVSTSMSLESALAQLLTHYSPAASNPASGKQKDGG